ncbi:hypothetical protein Cob_v002231 [Colletotrichum orbiculare MAFF 240422]|uniref:Uncharacterized protein n=1 Tax=Colletotrichum orbiculare (strain 104-T / ATCC 96160 / CBS 514.97 / LARS 414 / MAFF 240422) TaxID=1213857 RepID=N4VSV5_COLOR|nr:hypothetical protein Cob_v002231 [Colletotrichum orbiculare MAFF 240422]
MGSAAPNPIATITNNSGYDLDFYDVFRPSTDAGTKGTLEYTLLASVPNGASAQKVQTIHFASQVQAMFTGKIDALNGNYYQQFPVAVLAVSPFEDPNVFTITGDMLQSTVDSFKFIKYAQANPSSQLANKFRTAIADEKNQKDAVNKFFKATASFPLCTMTTWTAVYAWQAQFTNPWQGTYYLYSLGSGSGSTSSTSGSSTSSGPALVATLAIKASAAAYSATLTMAGTNDENTSVGMAGDGTMQEQDLGTGNLSVALTPTWLNVNQTSQQDGKTVSNYVIGAAFTGTINGIKVAGNLNKLSTPSSSDTSMHAIMKNVANQFTVKNFEDFIGMMTGIGTLLIMHKDSKQAEMQRRNDVQRDATSRSDAQARESLVEAHYQTEELARLRAALERVDATVSRVEQGYKQLAQAQDIQNMQDAVRQQEKQLQEVLEAGSPSQATEEAAMNLQSASNELGKAADPATSAAARDAALADATTTLANTSANLQKEIQGPASQFPQEEEKALRETQEALDRVQEQAKAQEEKQKEQEEQNRNGVDEPVDESRFEDPEPHFEGML